MPHGHRRLRPASLLPRGHFWGCCRLPDVTAPPSCLSCRCPLCSLLPMPPLPTLLPPNSLMTSRQKCPLKVKVLYSYILIFLYPYLIFSSKALTPQMPKTIKVALIISLDAHIFCEIISNRNRWLIAELPNSPLRRDPSPVFTLCQPLSLPRSFDRYVTDAFTGVRHAWALQEGALSAKTEGRRTMKCPGGMRRVGNWYAFVRRSSKLRDRNGLQQKPGALSYLTREHVPAG